MRRYCIIAILLMSMSTQSGCKLARNVGTNLPVAHVAETVLTKQLDDVASTTAKRVADEVLVQAAVRGTIDEIALVAVENAVQKASREAALILKNESGRAFYDIEAVVTEVTKVAEESARQAAELVYSQANLNLSERNQLIASMVQKATSRVIIGPIVHDVYDVYIQD